MATIEVAELERSAKLDGADSAHHFTAVQSEIQQLKDDISHQSKENFKLEKDLRYLDSKIALLIGHKISADELELRLFDDSSIQLPGSCQELPNSELYGRLFFTLQTSPHYVASLTRQVTLKEIDGLLQMVMFTLYGNQYEDREEHLLLSMFEHSLTYEVQEATEVNSLMRANTAITRMMTTYCRRGPGQEYVKSSLGEVVQRIMSYDKSLEIDPIKIFHDMMENEVVKKPAEPNGLLEVAQGHPTVREKIQSHIPILQDFVLQILQRLKETVSDVPYGIRWLCKAIKALVKEKFPDVTVERINSLIGGFFLLRYLNPIIVTPHNYRLVPTPPSKVARRNLTLIAKMIQKLANTSSVREDYMMPLEPFVRCHNEQLKSFLSSLCDVEDFHEALQLEEYIALCRKDVWIEISVSEVALIHSLLLKYKTDILTSDEEDLSTLLRDLPEPTDDMAKNQHAVLKLDLIRHSRENMGMPAFAPRGVSLDISDEMATTKRQCRHLLRRLFRVAPHCLDRPDLEAALKQAEESQLRDVPADARLASEHVTTLRSLGGPEMLSGLFEELKAVFQDKKRLLQEAQFEMKSLRSVHETMMEHSEFLMQQLDAYKEYLDAVRAKVGQVQTNNSYLFRKPRGSQRFTHTQLEKEGVIAETRGIPMSKRGSLAYTLQALEPGIYTISLAYKGQKVGEKTLRLEDLLEMQYLQDPVIDMEHVVLNVRRTLLLLSRIFMRRESMPSRPISRHFSTAAISTLHSTKGASA